MAWVNNWPEAGTVYHHECGQTFIFAVGMRPHRGEAFASWVPVQALRGMGPQGRESIKNVIEGHVIPLDHMYALLPGPDGIETCPLTSSKEVYDPEAMPPPVMGEMYKVGQPPEDPERIHPMRKRLAEQTGRADAGDCTQPRIHALDDSTMGALWDEATVTPTKPYEERG